MAKRILVVDDSALSRKRFLAKPLTSAGFEVVEAANGEEGLSALADNYFDCVITDLLMPVMDGFEFIEALNRQGLDAPVLVATADIQESSRQRIKEAGAAGFLNKPYTAETLIETVNQVLGEVAKG